MIAASLPDGFLRRCLICQHIRRCDLMFVSDQLRLHGHLPECLAGVMLAAHVCTALRVTGIM